ncbi:MAG TPA: hypothetical protein VGN80_17235 [Devosiaceae bacterium]|nr:hypothetical protein [Devosiaceae bacterium]
MGTTVEISEYLGERPQPQATVRLPLPRFLQNALRDWQERRAMVRISRLSPHLIRDMGFDPDCLYDALDGTWDEICPGRYRDR